MNQLLLNAKQANYSAGVLLSAQWIIALIAIPSAIDYDRQLDDGVPAAEIVTLYDNLSIAITIALIWSLITTSRLLTRVYDNEASVDPSAMRLKRGWVIWGWVVPVVSFWFPKRIVDDLLNAKAKRTNQANPFVKGTGTWWATWISYILLNDLSAFNTITGNSARIQPTYEIAAACMLTASYMVWTKIINSLSRD